MEVGNRLATAWWAARPDKFLGEGLKPSAGDGAGQCKTKKAFWEPPKKPFCKMFMQRKDIFSKAGVVPREGLVSGNIIFNANTISYIFSARSSTQEASRRAYRILYPSRKERRRGARICTRLGSARAPRWKHPHFVLFSNPCLESALCLERSKRKSPWTLPGWGLALKWKTATRTTTPTARAAGMIDPMVVGGSRWWSGFVSCRQAKINTASTML